MEERPCRDFQNGKCPFGSKCRYLHVVNPQMSSKQVRKTSTQKATETPEQVQARSFYHAWKRLIKRAPLSPDTESITKLWRDTLAILNSTEKEWKLKVPGDLENDEYHGLAHINLVLTLTAGPGGSGVYIDLVAPFLEVITHPALLGTLSVDSAVGGIYKFLSGSHGSRGIPFFEQFAKQLASAKDEASKSLTELEHTLMTAFTALHELVRREKRAATHDDLPELINSLEILVTTFSIAEKPILFQIFSNKITGIRGTINGTNDILQQKNAGISNGLSSIAFSSNLFQTILYPSDRHSNDKLDFTEMSILPTEDEIRSESHEFLPSTDPDELHFLSDPVARHLDTQFRLLRYDIFGEIKDALGGLMDAIEKDRRLLWDSRLTLGDNIHAYVYPGSYLTNICFDQQRGLEADISFLQPHSAAKLSTESERRKWWGLSSRLKPGSLLSLVFLKGKMPSVLFFSVSDRPSESKMLNQLAANHDGASILATLSAQTTASTEAIFKLHLSRMPCLLIELPGLLLPTFVPILENLQRMGKHNNLPFSQWILPQKQTGTGDNEASSKIPPPLYARGSDFTFSLDQILKDSNSQYSLGTNISENHTEVINELEERTTLDRGQCEGLVAALTKEFSLIQGPPGSGKSYLGLQLMKVLLSSENIGPIIVVCYTNHALDQFLEQLIVTGVSEVIRIGGKSKSNILRSKNLKVMSQGIVRTKVEGYKIYRLKEALKKEENALELLMATLHQRHKNLSAAELKAHVSERYPLIHSQFTRLDENNPETAAVDLFEAFMKDYIPKWNRVSPQQPEAPKQDSVDNILQGAGTNNIHEVSQENKVRLIDIWVQELFNDTADEIFEAVKAADEKRQELTKIFDQVDQRVLETAKVIGVTTTGLARRISVLQDVQSKIVVCEEAGEVMEPHLISALLPSCEHLVQIGDHQQLRPKINNFNLSLESISGQPYQLDRSQFERLSTGSGGLRLPFPVTQLNVQRRMRPEISTLIRQTIYPRLQDHDQVKSHNSVVGMRQDVFWLDHKNVEDGWETNLEQKSKSNEWEVSMVHALVRHIIRQGVYKSSEIAVLTPYTGQLKKLSEKFRSEFEVVLSDRDEETLLMEGFGVEASTEENSGMAAENYSRKVKMIDMIRIATVDNFQGEESQIVIVSLVRSNADQQVGFLKTKNRINVLLSRAKHGMYLIGNSATYKNVEMWDQVLNILRSNNAVGETFNLCCSRHPDQKISISQPNDFAELSPEGGCKLSCGDELVCGHECTSKCHSETMHRTFICHQPCERRFKPCNHPCRGRICGEDCGACMVELNNIELPCGHHQDGVLCCQTHNLQDVVCKFPVEKKVPGCGHMVQVACSRDVSESFKCPGPCKSELPCGHKCLGSCSTCKKGKKGKEDDIVHVNCTSKCNKKSSLGCGHTCSRPCHTGPCGICFEDCEVCCSHSRCKFKCHETCKPCIKDCTWSCEHQGECNLPCGASCDRLPCDSRCTKVLSCGHQCPSLCGEICPHDFCQICTEHKDAPIDLHSNKYSEVDLNDTPIIALPCGHLFTAKFLDESIGLSDVYHCDSTGKFTGLRDTSFELSSSMPSCPDCKHPLRQYAILRYNRMVNKVINDRNARIFLISGEMNLRLLDDRIQQFEGILTQSRASGMSLLLQGKNTDSGDMDPAKLPGIWAMLAERYRTYLKTHEQVNSFISRMVEKGLPALQLHEAVVQALSDTTNVHLLHDAVLANAVPLTLPLDSQVMIGGRVRKLQVDYIALQDELELLSELKSTRTGATLQTPAAHVRTRDFFRSCAVFIKDAKHSQLLRQCVKGIIFYACMARPFEAYCRLTNVNINETPYVEVAQSLLKQAAMMAQKPFYGSTELLHTVQVLIEILAKEWYQDIDDEEKALVDNAVKSVYSSDKPIELEGETWYRCENGHPFNLKGFETSVETVLCMECGAKIGQPARITAISG